MDTIVVVFKVPFAMGATLAASGTGEYHKVDVDNEIAEVLLGRVIGHADEQLKRNKKTDQQADTVPQDQHFLDPY